MSPTLLLGTTVSSFGYMMRENGYPYSVTRLYSAAILVAYKVKSTFMLLYNFKKVTGEPCMINKVLR